MKRCGAMVLIAVVMATGCATSRPRLSSAEAEQLFQYPKTPSLMAPELVDAYTNGYRIGWDSGIVHGGFGGGMSDEVIGRFPTSSSGGVKDAWLQGLRRGTVDAELTLMDLDRRRSNHTTDHIGGKPAE